jgi:hypothetical protein
MRASRECVAAKRRRSIDVDGGGGIAIVSVESAGVEGAGIEGANIDGAGVEYIGAGVERAGFEGTGVGGAGGKGSVARVTSLAPTV